MSFASRALALSSLVAVTTAAALGGWATISVNDLPDHAVAGQPMTLSFIVRQHGAEPMSGLKPTVSVRASGKTSDMQAVPGTAPGEYRAALILPEAGEWTVGINSNFGKSRVTLLPILAVAPGARAPVVTEAARGRNLFVAKGCVTCHVHADAGGANESYSVGPALSGRQIDSETMVTALTRGIDKGAGKRMPNPALKPGEIAALSAFLNGSKQASATPAP